MSNRKLSSEKVLKAMTLNQKEDRVLAKTFGTLDLEKKFAKNVLDLHVRTVRSNFRQLKEKVSKIRSNLKPEEITVLRQLEMEGKIKPSSTFNLNAAMKIAAAARRLQLYPEEMKRARSASAAQRNIPDNDKILLARANTANTTRLKRSNSVTGVFIDAPEPEDAARRHSIDPASLGVKKTPEATTVTIRPLSAVGMDEDTNQPPLNKERPSTTVGLDREKTSPARVTFQSNPQPSPSRNTHSNAPYSSHDVADKDNQGAISGRSGRETKSSFITSADDSIENNLGKDLFEERRIELLKEEKTFYKNLTDRKNEFIGKVDTYLLENPPVRFDTPVVTVQPISASDDEDDPVLAHSRRKRKPRQYDFSRTYTSEEEYKQRGAELWKDMNKTRYLRVSDDKLDLSGVVTLAKDQMKLYKMLKT